MATADEITYSSFQCSPCLGILPRARADRGNGRLLGDDETLIGDEPLAALRRISSNTFKDEGVRACPPKKMSLCLSGTPASLIPKS